VPLFCFAVSLSFENFRHILSTRKDIDDEAIVVTLAALMGWKESSVRISLVTPQILLFANPAVPDLPVARVDDEARST
jgi:hypothetical protein